MTCQDVIEFLMDYIAGTVPPRERALFEEHLAICPSCVAFLQNYREVMSMTKDSLPAPGTEYAGAVPDELVHAILAAREQQEKGKSA